MREGTESPPMTVMTVLSPGTAAATEPGGREKFGLLRTWTGRHTHSSADFHIKLELEVHQGSRGEM